MFASPHTALRARADPARSLANAREPASGQRIDPCFHCAEPVPPGTRWRTPLDGADRSFCCAGCLAIAQTIRAAGLADFYVKRTAAAATASETEDEWTQYDIVADDSRIATPAGDTREISLILEGIRCAACVWLNETYLRQLPGVIEFVVNFATQRARLVWSARDTRLSSVLRAIAAIGYRAYPYDPARREALARREGRALLKRAAVALLAMMQVMMFSVPGYVTTEGVEPAHQRLLDWASLILTLPVVVYCAAPFFFGALRDARIRRLGMDVPVALGVGAAFVASVWATFIGDGAVYFDSLTMFVALLLSARYVELIARQRAGVSIESIARERPQTAEHLPDYPAIDRAESIAASRLARGDIVRVAAGAVVPADGEVLAGRSSVEEAILTGESWPRAKSAGSTVLAGSVNRDSPLLVRVAAAGEATTAAALSRLVARAAEARPRVARLAERAAAWFVGVLLAIAAVTALVWSALDPSRTLAVTFAVLVVSCPCALSLATPAALAAAAGALGRQRILAVRPDALEALSRVNELVIDKTGTLTTGMIRLTAVKLLGALDRDQCLSIAAALEQGSAHPIATALRRFGTPSTGADGLSAVSGQGVEGTIAGRRYRCGRADWIAALHGLPLENAGTVACDAIVVMLGDESGWLASFEFGDSLREGAATFVAGVRAMGIAVSLVSGDRRGSVEHVAEQTGIADWHSDAVPEAKRAFIIARQCAGRVVAMVGDGINDAPSLAQADVSISLGSATALTQWAADIVVLGEDLREIGVAFSTARRTFRVMRQNLGWALAYNAISIPLAASGHLSPLVAAFGMSASSILVVANAWRLARITPAPSPRTAKLSERITSGASVATTGTPWKSSTS